MAEKKENTTIAQNKKALHDYFVIESYEAGIELFGTEVKSIRAGKVNIKESYCDIKDGEVFAVGMHISPYEKGNIFNKDPLRVKKLLLHKAEINKMLGKVKEKGIFKEYRNTLFSEYQKSQESKNAYQKFFVFQHFSMNRFLIDLKEFSENYPQPLSEENLETRLDELGKFRKNQIFGE